MGTCPPNDKPKAETIAGLGFRRFSVSMQDRLSPTSLRLGKASELALLSFYVRLHLAQFLVALVAQFGVALRGDEEFFGLLGVPRKGI